jgi:hypothetical protein
VETALFLCLLHLPCLPGELAPPPFVPEPPPPPPAPAAEPPPPRVPIAPERATYRIRHGLLGEVATVSLSLSSEPCADGDRKTILRGEGQGDVLGFGRMDKRLESDFDPRHRVPTRFTSRRLSDGKFIVDTASQPQPGAVSTERSKPGEPTTQITVTRDRGILDPLSFLLRVRLNVPAAPTDYEILDGRGFWRLSLAPEPCADPALIQLGGKAEMLYLDGNVDPHKTSRRFTLYLAKDRHHLPVKLILYLGMGNLSAELAEFVPRVGPDSRT